MGASQGQTRKKHNPLALAGVAIPLIDFERSLITGSPTLDMWPSEELQKARDKELKIKQGPLGRGPLGRYPDREGSPCIHRT